MYLLQVYASGRSCSALVSEGEVSDRGARKLWRSAYPELVLLRGTRVDWSAS